MIEITKNESTKIHDDYSALCEVATLLINQKTHIEVCAISTSDERDIYVACVRDLKEHTYDVTEAQSAEAIETYFRCESIDDARAFIASYVAKIEATQA